MTWLHHLTGFQLFVISSFYSVSLWQADERYARTKKWQTMATMLSSVIAGLLVDIWWLIYAAWPVISH